MIVVMTEDPGTPDAVALLDELSAALQAITGSSGQASFDANDVRVDNARFVVARDRDGQPVSLKSSACIRACPAPVRRSWPFQLRGQFRHSDTHSALP